MLPLLYAALCLMLLSVLTGVSGEQLTAVQTEVLSFKDAALRSTNTDTVYKKAMSSL
ncbi:hypothetical protein D4764_0220280 [Takifugu flavidus]|uniref:Uncharacterized protein n=1 Tax=Takifugu flavidus TaxID=433684 RepID=A0A5C6MHZ9_9TELE|nr:hypothetical protein D4764_0220280 [Takifugu flavidus]